MTSNVTNNGVPQAVAKGGNQFVSNWGQSVCLLGAISLSVIGGNQFVYWGQSVCLL